MRTIKKAPKRKKYAKHSHLVNLKVTESDYRDLYRVARRYTKGNLSAWLRFAGLTFRPKKSKIYITA